MPPGHRAGAKDTVLESGQGWKQAGRSEARGWGTPARRAGQPARPAAEEAEADLHAAPTFLEELPRLGARD